MNQNTIVQYKTKYGRIAFAFESDFWIGSIDGASSVTVNIDAVQSVQQTGASVSGQQVQAKTLIITGELVGTLEKNRREMLNVVRPMEPAQLSVIQDGYTAIIDGYPATTPLFNDGNGKQDFQFKFYCPWPYWNLGEIAANPFISTTSLFRFPFYTGGTWRISSYGELQELNVKNIGTAPTGFRVEWTILSETPSGTLILRDLTSSTMFKSYIYPYEVSKGDVLELCTLDGQRRFINKTTGKGLYNNMDNFKALHMALLPGDNYFKMDNETLDTSCIIYAPEGVLSGV